MPPTPPPTTDPPSTSRSPSPAAPPPIPLTSGPRAAALQNIFAATLTATLAKCSASNFAACFPTPAKHVPENLAALHRDFVGRLEESCNDNFEAVCARRGVVRGLNGLDGVLGDARARREKGGEVPVASHTLSPETLVQTHLHPFLASHAESLKGRVEEVQGANRGLWEELIAQREEIARLARGLESVVQELEKCAEVVDGGVAGLSEEAREVEEGLREGV